MTYQAFEPTGEHAETGISGATMAAPDGRTIDLKALLDDTSSGQPAGVIVTDDPFVIAALDGSPVYARRRVPDGFKAPDVTAPGAELPTDLAERTVADLDALLERRALPTVGDKSAKVARLIAHDAGQTPVGAEAIALQRVTPDSLMPDGQPSPATPDAPAAAAPAGGDKTDEPDAGQTATRRRKAGQED